MLAGINTRELVVGTGVLAERGKAVRVRVGWPKPGEERLTVYEEGEGHWVHLGKRESMIGLERGIEGMRVGGRRELVISPHLAGAWGRAGEAVRVEVELLEVREPGVRRPKDYPPGKHLTVFRPGEAARNLSRWQFHLAEDGRAGVHFTHPRPGVRWRQTRSESIEVQLEPQEVKVVFESVLATPGEFPQECLSNEECWSDASERGNGITRDMRTNTLCLWVSVTERGETLCNFNLREDSPALLGAQFYQIASRVADAHLKKRQEAQQEKPARGGFRWTDDPKNDGQI
jgi:peptidylprolyl isomerase